MPKISPISVADFAELTRPQGNYLFVDRTPLLKTLILGGAGVTAFHTFRRSGKTLFASMLHYFLSPKVLGKNTQGLFDNLAIGQQDMAFVQEYQGQYPVIAMTLKEIEGKTYESVCNKIEDLIKRVYRNHEYLLDSTKLSENDKKTFNLFYAEDQHATTDKLTESLLNLTYLLYKHHDKKVWLIIDEYDAPISKSFKQGFFEEMRDFMRGMLSAALKDNGYLEKGVLLGILRMTKESILSGLNNPRICTLLTPMDYKPYFGFTDAEVSRLFQEAELTAELYRVKSWYNGYQVGGEALYNPWSIISCIDNKGALKPYWVATSNDELIKDCLLYSPDTVKRQFQALVQHNEPIQTELTERIQMEEIQKDPLALWSLLYATGYLTGEVELTDEGAYAARLRIPNREIYFVYKEVFVGWLRVVFSGSGHEIFLNTIRELRIDKFVAMVEQYLLNYGSGRNLHAEGSYHNLVLGMLYGLQQTHEFGSDTEECGDGFPDLLIMPKVELGQKIGLLIECKHIRSGASEAEEEAMIREALTQIDVREYRVALEKHAHIEGVIKLAMVFTGKRIAWRQEVEALTRPLAMIPEGSTTRGRKRLRTAEAEARLMAGGGSGSGSGAAGGGLLPLWQQARQPRDTVQDLPVAIDSAPAPIPGQVGKSVLTTPLALS